MVLFNFKKLFSGQIPWMKKELKDVVEILQMSRYTVALTGAGISVESGIPDFRGPKGIWKKLSPSEFVRENFVNNPEKFWNLTLPFFEEVKKAKPNTAHLALARLEKMGYIKSIITQNIDNLHQEAGSKNVIEFHGNMKRFFCPKCGYKTTIDNPRKLKKIPKCPLCGNYLLPDIVFFGDEIDPNIIEKTTTELTMADVLVIIGTSAAVQPAAEIPYKFKEKGGTIIEINIKPTYLTKEVTDVFVPCDASTALEKLAETFNVIL